MILAPGAYDSLIPVNISIILLIIGIILLITLVISIIINHNNDDNSEVNTTTTTNPNQVDNDTNISDDVFNAFNRHDNVR